jgi:hypothetical protein
MILHSADLPTLTTPTMAVATTVPGASLAMWTGLQAPDPAGSANDHQVAAAVNHRHPARVTAQASSRAGGSQLSTSSRQSLARSTRGAAKQENSATYKLDIAILGHKVQSVATVTE